MPSARRRCALVVDSGAVLEPDPAAGVHVVPLRIVFGDEALRDGIDIDAGTFYSRLRAGEAPTTSTPSPGEYLEAFRAVDADAIVCLTIPATLSAMHGSATVAARLLRESGDERPVHVVDTGNAAAAFGLVARAAALLCTRGAGDAEVLERVASARDGVRMLGTLRTLTYLARSGRVPGIAAGVSDMLGVRPIFELRQGEAHRRGLVRGDHRVVRAFARLAEQWYGDAGPVWLLVCHAGAPDDASAVRDALHAVLAVGRSDVVALTPVVGAYTGPGMTGFAVMPLVPGELGGVP